MKKYENAKIEVVLLDGDNAEDIIRTSPNDNEVNIDDIFGNMGTAISEAFEL